MGDIGIFAGMLVCLLLGIFSGYYLFAVLGGVGFIFGYLFWGPGVKEMIFFNAFNSLKDYTLLAIPLFVFMGNMLDKSGTCEKLFDVLSIVLGKMRGGIAVAAMLIAIMFAATTGIVGASVVAMGLIFLPAMVNRGYDHAYASGVVSAGGTLGILIPPSIMLVVLGNSSSLSVGRLFYSAMMPGLLMGGLYIVYIIIRAQLNHNLAPRMPQEELDKYSTSWKVKGLIINVLPVLAIILAVLGAIYLGIAPPTEAAALGAFAATIVALCYRKLNLKVIMNALRGTIQTTSMVYTTMICAGLFVSVFMRLGGSNIVSQFFENLPFGTWGIFALMMFVIFLLGFMMDWLPASLIVVPVFLPIAKDLGFDPLWFITMIAVMFQTSFLTPPVAMALFYLRGVAPEGVTFGEIIRGAVPYIALQVTTFLLCCFFPNIVLWLPAKITGS